MLTITRPVHTQPTVAQPTQTVETQPAALTEPLPNTAKPTMFWSRYRDATPASVEELVALDIEAFSRRRS